jgi:hypothetical protein
MLFTAPLALFQILDAIFFSNPAVLLFRYISPTHILFHLLYPRSFWSSSFSLSLCYFRVGNMEEIHFLHPFLLLAIYILTPSLSQIYWSPSVWISFRLLLVVRSSFFLLDSSTYIVLLHVCMYMQMLTIQSLTLVTIFICFCY